MQLVIWVFFPLMRNDSLWGISVTHGLTADRGAERNGSIKFASGFINFSYAAADETEVRGQRSDLYETNNVTAFRMSSSFAEIVVDQQTDARQLASPA